MGSALNYDDRTAEGPFGCEERSTSQVKTRIGSYPHVRVEVGGCGVVSQAGSVLLVETVRKTGLDQAMSSALAPWRKQRAVHDRGKVLLDVALAVALGGDCLADEGMLRAEPAVFGPVASDPTVSRLIGQLADGGKRVLAALRKARAEVRHQVWKLAGDAAPGAGGQVVVDIDRAGSSSLRTPRSRTPPRPGRRRSGTIR